MFNERLSVCHSHSHYIFKFTNHNQKVHLKQISTCVLRIYFQLLGIYHNQPGNHYAMLMSHIVVSHSISPSNEQVRLDKIVTL